MDGMKKIVEKRMNLKLSILIALCMLLVGFKSACAYYVYDIEAENERNARQDPSYGQPWYDKAAEDRRNARQDPSYGQPWYDKAAEDRRNERQKPKKNDYDKSCSTKKHKTKYCPQRSPFIEMYFKDYSDVKNNPPFTRMYFKDYSDVKGGSEFTDRYLQDYSQ